MEVFYKNKRQIFGVVIFQEFLKELYASLFAKEMVVDMVDAYEQAY